jgi:hypothetical protein
MMRHHREGLDVCFAVSATTLVTLRGRQNVTVTRLEQGPPLGSHSS